MSCGTEALSPYTRDYADTTPAITPQRQFAQRLRGVLGRINARTRDAIIQRDLFDQRTEALVEDVPEDVFETRSDRAAALGFLRWLRQQLDENYLTVVGEDNNQFLRSAYAQGIRHAHRQVSGEDFPIVRVDVDDLLGRPFHRAELRTLYTRAYENLESVRDDTVQAVREELLEGFREGESPSRIAERLTDRVDSIGKHRSTLIARSEVMNAYSSGTLNRVEEINREGETTTDGQLITGHGEWDAAIGQERTCPFCRAMNGVDLTPEEMATTTVQFRGDVYRLKPPAHPNGRCNINVRVGPTQLTDPLQERLPAEVTLLT